MLRAGAVVASLALLLSVTACSSGADDADVEDQAGAWDAESPNDEASSTHLWIVDRAVDVLGRHTDDAVAARAYARLMEPTCHARWQQGLYDADFKAEYNNGTSDLPAHPTDVQVLRSGATWESHFYDPDTGANYKGTPKTAFNQAQLHLANARQLGLANGTPEACYELGLTLHYYTDLTQPMHASNFTALSRPAKLHSNLEHYAMEIQARYALEDWTSPPAETITVEDWIRTTAEDTKPLFLEGVDAIIKAYKSYSGWHVLSCRNIDAEPWRFIERQHVDYRHCWAGNAGVDAVVGHSLREAQEHTAKFIYLVSAELETTK